MLQWACASIGAILTTINPAYRLNELVSVPTIISHPPCGPFACPQVTTLNLVGVKHLFLVPQIRTSSYIHMLTDAFPSLLHPSPGEIQEQGLPDLRNLVVLDDKGEFFGEQRQKERLGMKSAIDWREVIMWR